MADRAVCVVTDEKFVEPCDSLRDAAEFGNPIGKQKGVWCYEYYNRTKPGPTRRFFGIKSGDFTSNGMAINFCPFCGAKIDAPFTGKNEVGAGETAEVQS